MSGYAGKLQQLISGLVTQWLQGPNAGAFLEAIGLTLDVQTQTLITGSRQAHPLRCFSDALPLIGADRGIKEYPTEPEQSYRARLARWRQIKRHTGSHYGQMLNLQPYFLPGAVPMIRIVHQDGDGATSTWHTLDSSGVYSWHRASPSNWDWDGLYDQWSRFWVIIYVDGIGDDTALYDDGTVYDDGHTVWGGHLTSEQIGDILAIVNEVSAPHMVCMGLLFVTDPAALDPSGTSVYLPDLSTTYPTGYWYTPANPVTGYPTIPTYITHVYTGP